MLTPSSSSPAPYTAHGPTDNETRSQQDKEDYRSGGGNGPSQKRDADILHILKYKDQRENPEYDAQYETNHYCPPWFSVMASSIEETLTEW
jgi:hypothetical protein